MSDAYQLGIRFPAGLVARIDAHVERLRAEAPWSKPNRAMAVRLLVETALDEAEKKAAKPSPRKK